MTSRPAPHSEPDELDAILERLIFADRSVDKHGAKTAHYSAKLAAKAALLDWSNKRTQDFSKVNRVEVIDHIKPLEQGGGRTVIAWEKTPLDVLVDLQDDCRTLKLFVSKAKGV